MSARARAFVVERRSLAASVLQLSATYRELVG
jgi:hypothetical protein